MAAVSRPLRLLVLVLAVGLAAGGVTALTVEPARAAVTFVGAASASSGGGNTVTISKPVGLQAGDVMLASIAVPDGGATPAPSGWIPIRHDQQASVLAQDLYYRVATATEPPSYVWTTSVAEQSAGAIVAYQIGRAHV